MSEAERKNRNETIANQRNELLRYSQQMAVDIRHFYEDPDTSGKIPMERRTAGSRLLSDIAAGHFDTLLVWKIDRLGRDTLDSLRVARRLKEAGIRIVSVTEPFDTSGPMGEFVFTLFASVAQMEHQNILERTMLGRLESVRRGQWTGGRVPYGYIVVEKRLMPHPEQAPIVRRMFTLYRSGTPTPGIAARFNAEGIPGPAGGDWDYQTINRMLKNRLYVGEAIYRKWRQVKRDGEYAGWERQPEENHIHYQVPALVTLEEFEACAHRREGAPRTGRRSRHYSFLLTSRIRCFRCQGAMHGNCCRKPDGGVYPYYRCPACRLTTRADVLDAAIWGDILGYTRDPGAVLARLHDQMEQAQEIEDVLPLERRIEAKASEEERVRGAFRRGIYGEAELADELATIRRETMLLRVQLEELRSRRVAAQNFAAQLGEAERLLRHLAGHMDTATEQERQEIAHELVLEVVVSGREDAEVTYRFWGNETGVLTLVSIPQLFGRRFAA